MNVDLDAAKKPMQRLRKLLKNSPASPGPEFVHALRTHIRKLEAVLHALSPGYRGKSRRLLKLLKPVRKSAGRVRDMDALIAKASTLSFQAQPDPMVRLVEQMSAIRDSHAGRLCRTLKRCRRESRSLLKHCLRHLERFPAEGSPEVTAPSPAQVLAELVERSHSLSRENLHQFRKGVKELRYRMQLVPGVDKRYMKALAQVKDATGEWHDWVELNNQAESILDPRKDVAMVRAIGRVARHKLNVALKAANALRRLGIEETRAA